MDRAWSSRSPEDVARGILTASGRHSDPNRAVAAARSLRRHELARIASADILGMLDVPAVCKALSSVWAAVLNASLSAVIKASVTELGDRGAGQFLRHRHGPTRRRRTRLRIRCGRSVRVRTPRGRRRDRCGQVGQQHCRQGAQASRGTEYRSTARGRHRTAPGRSQRTDGTNPGVLTTRTTRSGLRRGRFKHSFVRTRWPVILNWDCGSCT